jgi:hypothetical protein
LLHSAQAPVSLTRCPTQIWKTMCNCSGAFPKIETFGPHRSTKKCDHRSATPLTPGPSFGPSHAPSPALSLSPLNYLQIYPTQDVPRSIKNSKIKKDVTMWFVVCIITFKDVKKAALGKLVCTMFGVLLLRQKYIPLAPWSFLHSGLDVKNDISYIQDWGKNQYCYSLPLSGM